MKKLLLLVTLFSGLTGMSALAQKKTGKAPVKKAAHAKSTPSVKKPVPVAELDTSIKIRVITDLGEMVLKLSDKTPKHRDNFVKLVTEHFYDSLLFHRVINSFMIQGGDPNSKNAQPGEMLGMGDVGYLIPAEFDSTLFHKRGALCAARTNNPEKASSGCQFYIVQGRPVGDAELDNISGRMGIYYNPAKRMTYKMKGGTPFLDQNYTVFGEVISGFDVIDKIAQVQKDQRDRPLTDIRMRMELIGRGK